MRWRDGGEKFGMMEDVGTEAETVGWRDRGGKWEKEVDEGESPDQEGAESSFCRQLRQETTAAG